MQAHIQVTYPNKKAEQAKGIHDSDPKSNDQQLLARLQALAIQSLESEIEILARSQRRHQR